MTVFDDLHVRGLNNVGKTLYIADAEAEELAAAGFDAKVYGWDVEINDEKAAVQHKAAVKAWKPPVEPDPPGVTV